MDYFIEGDWMIYMNKPISQYEYYGWIVKDYDDWARQANDQGDCMLKMEYAIQIEKIYDNEGYTEDQHKENIAFLENLQYELQLVWSFSVREKSGMGNLVQDYKDYFDLK